MAKIRFSEVVEVCDVDEALRLMEKSQASVRNANDNVRERKGKDNNNIDHKSAIFAIITTATKNHP